MSVIQLYLQKAQQTRQHLSTKKSKPKICTCGFDITLRNEHSKNEQKILLSKFCDSYHQFIDNTTKKFKQIPTIKRHCNIFKIKRMNKNMYSLKRGY